MELEIAELEEDDRAVFMEDLGITETAAARFIRGIYELMSCITFFTAGDNETRAWTISKGTTAVEAAGKIHSDLARGFIRAEVYSFADLEESGDEKAVKAAGKFHLQAKEYVVEDGDIINIRFNV